MLEGNYGKEPFDLRLTVLCLFRRWRLILGVTLLGTLLFGGGYYVKNVLLQRSPDYSATSVYRVEYAIAEEWELSTVHINEMTWNTYVDTQMFLDQVRRHLPTGTEISDETLQSAVSAVVASNLKVVSTVVTMESEEESLTVATAVEAALVQDFPEKISEIISISVMDPAREAKEVYPDVRPLRAVVLSALLSFFFVVVFLLLKELGDDNIHLPSTLGRRYGLKAVGTTGSSTLNENIHYLFADKKRVAICPVQTDLDAGKILEDLRAAGSAKAAGEAVEWISVSSPIREPESGRILREADGILLAVSAGSHAGKQLEAVLEYLELQECKITGVILVNADERLLKWYYKWRRSGDISGGTV